MTGRNNICNLTAHWSRLKGASSLESGSLPKASFASTLRPKGGWPYDKCFTTMATRKLGTKGSLAVALSSAQFQRWRFE